MQELALAEAEAHDELVEHGALAAIQMCMDRAAASEEAVVRLFMPPLLCDHIAHVMQKWAISAYWNLAFHPANEARLLDMNFAADIRRCQVLFPDSRAIQVRAPSCSCSSSPFFPLDYNRPGLETERLQEKAFGAFAAAACSDKGQNKMVADDIHLHVIQALLSPGLSSEAIRWGCTFLANVADGTYDEARSSCNHSQAPDHPVNQECLGRANAVDV